MRATLTELARLYGTDKLAHGFISLYESWLEQRRDDVKHVLEIGVWQGQSLRMWRDYFPNANVVGWDIKAYDDASFGSRTATQAVDQSSLHSMCQALSNNPVFDLVIDDGSRRRLDQQLTLGFLWRHLVTENLDLEAQAKACIRCGQQQLFCSDCDSELCDYCQHMTSKDD